MEDLNKIISDTIREYINENKLLSENNLNDNFWKWFGNSVLVKNGKPLIVYHGTNTKFTQFDINKMRSGWLGKGFYFTENEIEAGDYGSIVLPVYLKLLNPFIIESDKIKDDGSVEFSKSTKEQLLNKFPEIKNNKLDNVANFLLNKGYDGVINSNTLITVFNPNQIKSIKNDGNWDITDNNIYS